MAHPFESIHKQLMEKHRDELEKLIIKHQNDTIANDVTVTLDIDTTRLLHLVMLLFNCNRNDAINKLVWLGATALRRK